MVMACVTLRKRKLSHWCGQDTGAYGPMTCIYRKILQFPAVAVATVGRIISRYQNHLKVIPRHSRESGTVLLYRTVNGQPTHTYTNIQFVCVQCDKQTVWMYTGSSVSLPSPSMHWVKGIQKYLDNSDNDYLTFLKFVQ